MVFTQMKKGRDAWTPLETSSSDFQGRVEETDHYYDFRGETVPLERFLALNAATGIADRILKSYE